jgi:ATP-dependent Clp protease protease subunit
LIESRTVLVSGPITDKLAREFTKRLMVIERMDPERPVTIMINSPGGSADSGFAMYDLMRFVTPPLITVVNGLCASAAILVLLGTEAKRRFSMPESRFMIHQPATTGQGTASDLDITAREILKLRERYNRIISDASGQKMERVLEDSRRDFWLNSAEGMEYGLVSQVVTERRQLED